MTEDAATADRPLAGDAVGLLEGIVSTRAIRRYTAEPIPESTLRDMLFAATRAPSGSNRQPVRYLVLRDGPDATAARTLLGNSARSIWHLKRERDGYQQGSGREPGSPKGRMTEVMGYYVDHIQEAPVIVLVCHLRYRDASPLEGANVYPACQNLLLAARALGFGGVMTGFHRPVESELKALLGVPERAFIAATITLGRPAGRHGPVRRLPLGDVVFEGRWETIAEWAVDPPGTSHASAGPPGTWAESIDPGNGL